MEFLFNRWYVAAWPEEIGRHLLARTFLGRPVLLYRTEDGQPVALQDRCPHRFVPLSRGRLEGDIVECGYHGLQFGATGACVFNPHGDRKIPPNAAVARYPIVERHGLVWIWPGNPAAADPALISDHFAFMAGPSSGYRTVHNYLPARYSAELLIDNLMDLSHAEFLHRGSFSAGYAEESRMRSYEEGETVRVDRYLSNTVMPPYMRPIYDVGDAPVDQWQEFRWVPPGVIRYEFGLVRTGEPREKGAVFYATHIATPETATTTHYFASISRSIGLNDADQDEAWRLGQFRVVETEDSPMLETQQAAMGGADLWDLKPVFLETDAGAMRVRRMMTRLLHQERQESAA